MILGHYVYLLLKNLYKLLIFFGEVMVKNKMF